jgi:NAD(P)-dependent dehydrogenase (short-subunit alcohol dehydrogenase family)
MELQGATTVVTGAGKGIGRAIAQMLVSRGANVALVARREETLHELQAAIDPEKRSTLAIVADVADEADVERVFATVAQTWGPVQLLVNNAGVGTKGPTPVGDYETSEYDRIVDVNLKGAFFCARAAVQHMRGRTGTILNIASIAGNKAAPNVLPYNVSKFGMRALSETLLAENLMNGIKVHTISPGATRTSIWEAKAKPIGDDITSNMLNPEDVASTAEFLITLPDHVRIDEVVVLPNTFPVRLWDYKLLDPS